MTKICTFTREMAYTEFPVSDYFIFSHFVGLQAYKIILKNQMFSHQSRLNNMQ